MPEKNKRIYRGMVLMVTVFLLGGHVQSAEKEAGTSHASPYAKLQNVKIGEVRWTDGFWADRFQVCHEAMIPNMWRLLEDPEISHAYENFLVAAGLKEGRHRGPTWHDGDFYKWLEAAAYTYALTKDEKLNQQMDQIIDVIGRAQREDGYIHTPVIIDEKKQSQPNGEFKNRLDFETYNMGHLMTCACIHYHATGKTSLLRIARKSTDYLYEIYKAQPEKLANNAICPSHYMGIMDMYRTTRDPRYLELAAGLIDIRGMVKNGLDDNQDRIPFYEQREAVGHAVRANYLYAGAADILAETGDERLRLPLESIWNDVVYRKLYITGATGALYNGASPDGSKKQEAIQPVHQAFGRPYQLPNITAHNESCASVGFVLWNQRMLALSGQARFADALELALYNGVLAAISLDGKQFLYTNALRVTENLPFELRWSRTRQPYIKCFCCPPNVVRTIAEAGMYAYSLSDRGVWIHLYGNNLLDTKLPDGMNIKLSQQTAYPWDGQIRIMVQEATEKEVSIFLRIPGWADDAGLKVNGRRIGDPLPPGQYYEIRKAWSANDQIVLVLPMPVRLMEANPFVEETLGQTAVQRGPIVYCLESVDLSRDLRVMDIALSPSTKFKSHFENDLLGGVTVLEGRALVLSGDSWGENLYRDLSLKKPDTTKIRLIPYYAWGNRGQSEMTVWMPLR